MLISCDASTMRSALHVCLLACAVAHVPRRTVLQRGLAAPVFIALPHAAAAATQPKTPPATPRSAALDAAGYAYALVRATDGGQVVTLDLDRTNRARGAAYFYETRSQADAVRSALAAARPNATPLALARVPLGEAAAMVMAPPAKREGVPGYFCHRLLVEPSRLAAARRITGLGDLGDRVLPLFYVDDDVGSREASGGVQAFWDPKAAELVRKEATTCSDRRAAACRAYEESGRGRALAVREADAFVLLRRGDLDDIRAQFPEVGRAIRRAAVRTAVRRGMVRAARRLRRGAS